MSDRPPSFQFYPRDFTSSAAVRLMTPEARGGYVMLLCQAWMAEEPGVLEDDDLILAGLSELGERWPACKESIRRAFRATSREGRKVLVQPRMVEERERQRIRYEQASKGGRARAAGTRDKLGRLVPQHQDSTSPTPPLASASALDSDSSASSSASAVPDLLRGKVRVRASRAARIPPAREELAAYCAERAAQGKPPVDPAAWWDHYESNGWRVGRSPMRDWQAAVRTWERNGGGYGSRAQRPGYNARGGLTPEAIGAFAAKLREQENRR